MNGLPIQGKGLALITNKANQHSDDNMIPLINIVFLLLIFFMVAGQIKAQPDKAIELVKSSQFDTAQNASFRLELLQDGKIKLDGQSIQVEQLNTLISIDQKQFIALFADGRATAKQLDTLMSHIPSSNNIQLKLFTMEKP